MPLCSASALMQQSVPSSFQEYLPDVLLSGAKAVRKEATQTWLLQTPNRCSLCGFIFLPQTDVDFFNWFVSFSRSSVLSFPIIFIQSSFPILHENIFANHETWWCWELHAQAIKKLFPITSVQSSLNLFWDFISICLWCVRAGGIMRHWQIHVSNSLNHWIWKGAQERKM